MTPPAKPEEREPGCTCGVAWPCRLHGGPPEKPCAADDAVGPCPDPDHCDPCSQRDIFASKAFAPAPSPLGEPKVGEIEAVRKHRDELIATVGNYRAAVTASGLKVERLTRERDEARNEAARYRMAPTADGGFRFEWRDRALAAEARSVTIERETIERCARVADAYADAASTSRDRCMFRSVAVDVRALPLTTGEVE